MSFTDYAFGPTQAHSASDDDHEAGPSNFNTGIKRGSRGPSFKRGPPKGYIHAIEQRWHQVECILGSIMAAPQAEGIVSELRGDPMARTILDRVESGPYGPHNRGQQSATNSENFYATIMGTTESPAREDRRQRLGDPYSNSGTDFSNWDEVDDTVDSFGHLALDDTKEIRYHGHASGLPLLARSDHPSGANKDDGFWKFPPIKQEDAPDKLDDYKEADSHVQLPPLEVQRHLVDLYFAWVHPFFPVIHKQHFLADFPLRDGESPDDDPAHHSTQKVNKLLLLAMFSNAARYGTEALWNSIGENRSNAGAKWAAGAREIINSVFQCSRPSTVQALLLIGIREFGLGSMEQGWLLTGMALRMAVDLGLNRNSDKWIYKGKDLFSPVEKQIRKQIWWSACVTDKLSAMWMGRPVTFRANDYTTLLPEVHPEDAYEVWQPSPPNAFGPRFSPRPAMTMRSFHTQCELSVIITDIMNQIYPVSTTPESLPRRQLLQRLEERLHKWQINLPEELRYLAVAHSETPLPHILVLHIEYYAAVLLLHRAFIPHANGRPDDNAEGLHGDPVPMKSLDICQSAASQISTIATLFDEKYGLSRAPPFLTIYLQSAGIMHVITLSRRPSPGHPQASQGLKQSINALGRLGSVWPSAERVRVLLEGAVGLATDPAAPGDHRGHRPKRSLEQALGEDMNSDVYGRHTATSYTAPDMTPNRSVYDEDANTRAMLHSLGLELPTIDPTVSTFLPPYQYWPRQTYDAVGHSGFMDASAAGPLPAPSVGESSLSAAPFTFNQNDLAPQFVQGVHYPVLDPSNLFPVNLDPGMLPDQRHQGR
ncbi:fungal-specific transcription factor domain-containing protein [Fomitopsis serialis]|uniref:fungal-specific transcription factor domain-containing protein n=1 Tax=Fomitopsis serialis TaxID=139415 RepID=UPI002008C741|nr:fungal-specific transcription factor domain-containing protein [Neoantrodia serialis]KAH9937305.1 fungal-specific transcription factor domain-containing protein [Neoantrodia serialis]